MGVKSFEDLKRHVGHEIKCVFYAKGSHPSVEDADNISLECETCCEVLISFDRPFDWIKCNKCGWKSYNQNDIYNRYCGHCHAFHKSPEDYEVGYDEK